MYYETSRTERSAYALFFVGQNIAFMLSLQFLGLFYTDFVGLEIAAVGLLFLIARIWDAVNDPILGNIVDRSRFKGGKFLPWIKTANFVLPVLTFLIFVDPGFGDTGKLVYAYVTYVLWGMVYTLCDVPVFALSTAMTKDENERVLILTWGRMAALIAGLIVAAAGMPMIQALGWTRAAAVLSALAFITMLPIRYTVRERYTRQDRRTPSTRDTFEFLLKHRPMLTFYVAVLFAGSFNTVTAVGNYFAIYNLGGGKSDYVMPMIMSGFLPLLVLAPLIPAMIRKWGKKTLMVGWLTFGSFVSIAQYFIGYDNFAVTITLNAIRSGAMYVPLLMIGMFSADFVEWGEYHFHQRLEGTAFSLQTFMTKLTQALSAGIGTMILGAVGYIANQIQTPDTLSAIYFLYTVVPAIGCLIAVAVMWFWYNLSEEHVQDMIDKMRTRRDPGL